MKLEAQINLWFSEGNSDKLYEVDLLQVGENQYVVNFRYGRRGANLKDGSKTPLPVDLVQARKIFDALVAEKKKGGYQETSSLSSSPISEGLEQDSSAPTISAPADAHKLVQRLSQAVASPDRKSGKWTASRIIWRIGELRMQDPSLEDLLIGFMPRAKDMEQYVIAWALGRIGKTSNIASIRLRSISEAAATKPMVRRIARIAAWEVSTPEVQAEFAAAILANWPVELRLAIQGGEAQALNDALTSIDKHENLLPDLYLLLRQHPSLGKALQAWIIQLKPVPGRFRAIRQLYKLALFYDDADLFAHLALVFERETAYYRRPAYGSWVNTPDGYLRGYKEERSKEESKLAYSDRTRQWLRRNSMRYLKMLGSDAPDEYVRIASKVLLQHDDAVDRKDVRTSVKYTYDYRQRKYNTKTTHYDSYAASMLLHGILFARTSRYTWKTNAKAAICLDGYEPGKAFAKVREDAFPGLWDAHPEALLELLRHSRCGAVNDFALLAFQNHPRASELMDAGAVRDLIGSSHMDTVRWALGMVDRMYDPQAPDLALVRVLASHRLPEARSIAGGWVAQNFEWFSQQPGFVAELIVQPFPDVSAWLSPLLPSLQHQPERINALMGKVMALLMALPGHGDDATANALADASAQQAGILLATHFLSFFREASIEVVADLLNHPLPNVAIFGTIVLQNHVIAADRVPSAMVAGLLQSPIPELRRAGVRVFSSLPDVILLSRKEELVAFCISPFPELRETIQPAIQRLGKDPQFAGILVQELLPWMQRKEAHEGLQEDLLRLFTESLNLGLESIGRDRAVDLLFDRRAATQRLGLFVIAHAVDPMSLTMRQVMSFANHERHDVRKFSYDYYKAHPARIQEAAREALRILDSNWDDARAFGKGYFRDVFPADAWTPELLVFICDSTREDIQYFGREMLSRHFQDMHGEQYLVQLSQHPASKVQAFAALLLSSFASQRPDLIERLEGFFITLLSQVNKGGYSKQVLYQFLERESAKSESAALVASRVLGRQSASTAVGDKAQCIRILTAIRKQYPHLESPLQIVPIQVP